MTRVQDESESIAAAKKIADKYISRDGGAVNDKWRPPSQAERMRLNVRVNAHIIFQHLSEPSTRTREEARAAISQIIATID